MADFFSTIQPAVGIVLFLAAGWTLTMALFKEEDIDIIERAAFALAFALVIPALVILFLNLVLQVKMSTLLVFVIYALITAGSYAYAEYIKKPRKH